MYCISKREESCNWFEATKHQRREVSTLPLWDRRFGSVTNSTGWSGEWRRELEWLSREESKWSKGNRQVQESWNRIRGEQEEPNGPSQELSRYNWNERAKLRAKWERSKEISSYREKEINNARKEEKKINAIAWHSDKRRKGRCGYCKDKKDDKEFIVSNEYKKQANHKESKQEINNARKAEKKIKAIAWHSDQLMGSREILSHQQKETNKDTKSTRLTQQSSQSNTTLS